MAGEGCVIARSVSLLESIHQISLLRVREMEAQILSLKATLLSTQEKLEIEQITSRVCLITSDTAFKNIT